MMLGVLAGITAEPRAQTPKGLFPRPLHLVRTIDDPLAGVVVTVDQYCAGNRVVTVRGERVSIADYGRQELTEIDRAAGTYSITPFDAIAKSVAPPKAGGSGVKVEVKVSERVMLSRDALDVLIGAAYPNPRRAEHDAIRSAIQAKGGLRAASQGAAKVEAEYALPTEQIATFDAGGGESVVVRDAVVHIGSDDAPAEVLVIPAGAVRVESPRIKAARELRALDELPPRQ